jgi:CubicO group peptidase (beta-lactamase class C family)
VPSVYCGGGGLLGNECLNTPEPAPNKGLIKVLDYNHFTIRVTNQEHSVAFYQRLFGLPIDTYQGSLPVLRVGTGKHIPEFKDMLRSVPDYDYESTDIKLVMPDSPLTVEDCLNHTHGLPATEGTDAAESIRERVMASARGTLDWEPGSKWRYGGEGLHVAAYLVEKYSGMSYADFLQKRIFDPLGMKDTFTMPGDVPKDRTVEPYKRNQGEKAWKVDRFFNPVYFRPDGGLYSTAENMFRFYQMMLNGGTYQGKRLLSKQSVKQLTTITCGHLEKGDHIENCFSALGFRVVREATDPRTTGLNPGAFGHGGSGGSIIWADPANDTIYIYMRNNWGSNQTPMVETFQKIVSAAVK